MDRSRDRDQARGGAPAAPERIGESVRAPDGGPDGAPAVASAGASAGPPASEKSPRKSPGPKAGGSPPAVSADFVLSAAAARQFPETPGFEVALLGRSNCGKSSLLNRWLGRRSLARVGAAPGRTRLINFFNVLWTPGSDPMMVADLPGYGYAAAPKAMVESWRRLVEDYLRADRGPRLALLLMDIRRGAQDEERGLAAWLSELGIDRLVVATKSDKLPPGRGRQALAALGRDLGVAPLAFSSLTGQGREELIAAVLGRQAAALAGK